MLTPLEQLMSGQVRPGSVDVVVTKKNELQDSEMTPPTETGSVSEDEGNSWFGGIGTDFRTLANSIKETIPPAFGGIASFVHRSALSVAAEIAALERDSELETERWRADNYRGTLQDSQSLHLPWEVKCELADAAKDGVPLYMTNEELMDAILALSLKESTFLEPFSQRHPEGKTLTAKTNFVLDQHRIQLIRRLLDIDENLAAMHARLSGE